MLSLIPPGGRGLVVICLVAGLGLGLSACGRRGYPEAPPDAPASTRPRADVAPSGSRQASAADEDVDEEKNPEDRIATN